jgi:hypothetical protein
VVSFKVNQSQNRLLRDVKLCSSHFPPITSKQMEMNSMVSEESLGVGPGVGPGSVVVAQWPEVGLGVDHGLQEWVRW